MDFYTKRTNYSNNKGTFLTKKLKMTTEDQKHYQDSQDCWIWNEKLDETKVRDHCHITGKYRGAAHNQCNLKLKNTEKITY